MTITHPLLEAEEAKDELLAKDGAPGITARLSLTSISHRKRE